MQYKYQISILMGKRPHEPIHIQQATTAVSLHGTERILFKQMQANRTALWSYTYTLIKGNACALIIIIMWWIYFPHMLNTFTDATVSGGSRAYIYARDYLSHWSTSKHIFKWISICIYSLLYEPIVQICLYFRISKSIMAIRYRNNNEC